jgi:hypothetical protein
MIIEDKRDVKTVEFKDIPIGECFTFIGESFIAMRIPPIDDTYNIIYLDTGDVEFIHLDVDVIPVKAKVVVE